MAGYPGQCRAGIQGQLQPYSDRRCRLSGLLYDCGEYPGLVEANADPEAVEVIGELYEVADATTLARLDYYEGFDPLTQQGEFVRRRVRLRQPQIDCWVYFYTGMTVGKPRVPNGDWSCYVKQRDAA